MGNGKTTTQLFRAAVVKIKIVLSIVHGRIGSRHIKKNNVFGSVPFFWYLFYEFIEKDFYVFFNSYSSFFHYFMYQDVAIIRSLVSFHLFDCSISSMIISSRTFGLTLVIRFKGVSFDLVGGSLRIVQIVVVWFSYNYLHSSQV